MILITGASGQLGQDFQQLFRRLGVEYIATSRTAKAGGIKLDITDHDQVSRWVNRHPFRWIINCAAYNDVDQAEEDRDAAFVLNKEAPAHLARVAREIGAGLVTFSTDFVFDGTKRSPYTETDHPHPLNVYGQSKLEGEQAVMDTMDNVFVIRTSWVFGAGNHNFNRSVIEWSRTKEQLQVVDDQVSAPTYSRDLAECSWALVQSGRYGLYHLSGGGEASKYDQARHVLERIGWKGELKRARTEDFSLPAPRAAYTKLDNTKAERIVGRSMPDWRDAVDRYLNEIGVIG